MADAPALVEGDTVMYGVSALVRHNGQEAWVKCDATSKVQKDEDPEEARFRVSDFVNAQIEDAIEEIKAS